MSRFWELLEKVVTEATPRRPPHRLDDVSNHPPHRRRGFRRFVVVGVWIEYEDGHVMALKPVTGGRRLKHRGRDARR
jgi:hypothetical protein